MSRAARTASIALSLPFLAPLVAGAAWAAGHPRRWRWPAAALALLEASSLGLPLAVRATGRDPERLFAAGASRLAMHGAVWGSVLAGAVAAQRAGAPPPVATLLLAYGVVGTSFAALNAVWKISLHTGIATSTSVALLALHGRRAAPALLLVPLAAWARLRLGAHTPAQVLAAASLAGAIAGSLWRGQERPRRP